MTEKRTRNRVRLLLRPACTLVSLVVGTGMLVALPSAPATAAADPAPPSSAGPAVTSLHQAVQPSRAGLRDPAAAGVQPYGPEQAEAVIQRLLDRQARDVANASLATPRRWVASTQSRPDRTRQAEDQLREALAALEDALAADQCEAVGGLLDATATISCPLLPAASSSDGPSTIPAPTDAAPLRAPVAPLAVGRVLADAELQQALHGVLAEWSAAGADVTGITAALADLPGTRLGQAAGRRILVDPVAGGWGWDRMDLATALRHETGHALGLGHSATGLMAPVLLPGERLAVPSSLPPVVRGAVGPLALTGGDEASVTEDPPAADEAATAAPEPAVEPAPDPTPMPAPEPDPVVVEDPSATAPEPAPEPTGQTPSAEPEPQPTTDPVPPVAQPDPAPTPDAAPAPADEVGEVRGRWARIGATAKLIVDEGDGAGVLFYDAATDEIVFRFAGVDNRTPADGIRRVLVKGGAADELTIDLRSFPRGRDRIEVEIEGRHDSVDVVSDEDVEVSGPEPGTGDEAAARTLLVESLLAILRIAAPQLVAKVEAVGATIVITGHIDLSSTGASLELTAQRVLADQAAITTAGSVTLTALADSPGMSEALIALRDATIFADDITLTATAHGGTGASAVVEVVGSRLTATGAVEILADASLTATSGGELTSVAIARLADSVVDTPGELAVTARNTTSLKVRADDDVTARLAKLTSASIAGVTKVSAATVRLTAVSTGSATVDARGRARLAVGSTTEAGLAPGTSLDLHHGTLVASAVSRHATSATGDELAVVLVDSRTSAAIGTDATLTGADDVLLLADTTQTSTASSQVAAVVSSLVQTEAVVDTGAPLSLTGDLELVAVQDAAATATGDGTVLVFARHEVAAELRRVVAAGGVLRLTADGLSLTSPSNAGRWVEQVAAGHPGVTAPAAPPVVLPVSLEGESSLAPTTTTGVLPARGLPGGGPQLTAVAGSGSAALGLAGGAVTVPAVAIDDLPLTAPVRPHPTGEAAGPIVDYSGRGPPSGGPDNAHPADLLLHPTTRDALPPTGDALQGSSSAAAAVSTDAGPLTTPGVAPAPATAAGTTNPTTTLPAPTIPVGAAAARRTSGAPATIASTHPAVWGGPPGGLHLRVVARDAAIVPAGDSPVAAVTSARRSDRGAAATDRRVSGASLAARQARPTDRGDRVVARRDTGVGSWDRSGVPRCPLR